MSNVILKNVTKIYDKKVVINNIDLEIKDKEFVVLVGASGCGKSTILRMIAGLEEITSGEILIGDKKVNDIPPKDRDIAFVFQSYALYPHMTVRENIAFGLKMRKVDKKIIEQKVKEAAEILDLTEYLDRKPKQLSGGQRQRVALGRAIVRNPKVFLMDEPLSNLDAKLRVEMRSVIRRIQKQFGITTVYVTHDQAEALSISDRIAIMNKGVIQQIGTPFEVYRQPRNIFSATFIGESSLLDATYVQDGSVDISGYEFTLAHLSKRLERGEAMTLCIRPDDFYFAEEGLSGRIEECTYLGSNYEYIVALDNGSQIKADIKATGEMIEIGTKVFVRFNEERANAFSKEGGNSLMEYYDEEEN